VRPGTTATMPITSKRLPTTLGPRRRQWLGLAACLVLGSLGSTVSVLWPQAAPATADGAAPCTVGPPPFPFAGFCATYSGANTWYGSYGPGFPTPQGWAFCANPPASGGFYPAPDYDYAPSSPPAGADDAYDNALGFAFGEAQAEGWWGGSVGRFTADQAAVAGKLLYDAVVWGDPIPPMDPGVLAAYDSIDGWFNQASGATGVPTMTTGLVGGGASFSQSASWSVQVVFPGTGHGLAGLPLALSIADGSFNAPGGPSEIGVSTDANGQVTVPIYANGSSVTVTALAGVGQIGLDFYRPTADELSAQQLVAFPAPITLQSHQVLSTEEETGTIKVVKSGDDQSYYPVQGAVFEVLDQSSGNVEATLTTRADGLTPAAVVASGTYTVREVTAPPGYSLAPDQTATVDAGSTTTVSFTGPDEDRIHPASLSIVKADSQSGVPLAGAVFDVRYDKSDVGAFSQDVGTCTTGTSGTCDPPGNDGSGLLPGNYQVTELAPPPGYALNPATATQTISLAPGEDGRLDFSDLRLGSVQIAKRGDDTAYATIAGAVFTLSGPTPSTTLVGRLLVGDDGTSNVVSDLVPGSYVLTETEPPPGYEPVAPQVVSVPGGNTTVIDVFDRVQPARLTITKVDLQTHAPIAGAVFDVRYAPTPSSSFDADLGRCTTDQDGTCTPAGNDGPGALLPGDYQITETAAPPGYALTTANATQVVDLSPGESASVTFRDPLLVAATFQKVATGNVDPAQVILAGATIDVTPDTTNAPGPPLIPELRPANTDPSSPQVGVPTAVATTCTTGRSGSCTTSPVLVSGERYCWTEPTAPPGLLPGASGCFVATNDQASRPISVTDPGDFVGVSVRKVDRAQPGVGLEGATFDLYRLDGGTGPDHPSPPAGTAQEPNATWVGRAVTGPTGTATFPLQFPGYAYCALEVQPPLNYQRRSGMYCSTVLRGTVNAPAPVANITVADDRATVDVSIHKFDALAPDVGVAGATYDLYVEGPLPPGASTPPRPANAVDERGDTWFERGATNSNGDLTFTVPAGYAWCVREVTSAPDYVLDEAIHCTAVLDEGAPSSQTTLAIPEVRATVRIAAFKFDSLQPHTVIPDATYELLVQGVAPPGSKTRAAPPGASVPTGDAFWAVGTTNAQGVLTFAVPAGYAWCFHELRAPSDYRLDPAFHCTAVITTDSSTDAATIAIPEVPTTTSLAFTGGPGTWMMTSGAVAIVLGSTIMVAGRRRRAREPRAAARDRL